MRTSFFTPLAARRLLYASVLSLLAACGGGGQTEGAATTPIAPNATSTQAVLEAGAKLNAAELEQVAKTGVLPQPFDGPLLSGAEGSTAATLNVEAATKSSGERKSAASRVPAYRFFNGSTGAHFYTTSTTERDNTINNLPAFSYEGPAFYVSATTVPGLSPVHRFYNTQSGVHFYTISEAERANVAANLPQFNYEGIAYYASTLSGTGYTPLYRFFVSAQGFHFYTNSLAERDNIIATLPQYSYEGIGYYVLGDDWQTPAVPHTGVFLTQCYEAGSDVFVSCFSPGAISLNSQQDGRRITINTMVYNAVSGQPSTECMRDNVTGLVWEVKTAAGTRAGSNTYRRTLGFAGDPTTTGAYTTAVNNMNLCGFDDWRLPTLEELHGVINFARTLGPRINTVVFPNAQEGVHWTATDQANDSNSGWVLPFNGGSSGTTLKSNYYPVRLVRGAPWVGQRYVVTTQTFPGDAANNAVIDRKTGLTWRRCMEGQVWGGVSCSGVLSEFSHQEALAHPTTGSWRVPNAKELTSLVDQGQRSPALDADAFPGGSNTRTWSTTPLPNNSGNAWLTYFFTGTTYTVVRTANTVGVRLVYTAE